MGSSDRYPAARSALPGSIAGAGAQAHLHNGTHAQTPSSMVCTCQMKPFKLLRESKKVALYRWPLSSSVSGLTVTGQVMKTTGLGLALPFGPRNGEMSTVAVDAGEED